MQPRAIARLTIQAITTITITIITTTMPAIVIGIT